MGNEGCYETNVSVRRNKSCGGRGSGYAGAYDTPETFNRLGIWDLSVIVDEGDGREGKHKDSSRAPRMRSLRL